MYDVTTGGATEVGEWDGAQWTARATLPARYPRTGACAGPGESYVAGDNGFVFAEEPGRWWPASVNAFGYEEALPALVGAWVDADASIYAMADDGLALVYDGAEWAADPGITGTFRPETSIRVGGFWAGGARDMYATAVAYSGQHRMCEVLHFSGQWETAYAHADESTCELGGVWNDGRGFVAAVGSRAVTGASGSWSVDDPAAVSLVAVWGSSRSNVFAVGDGGAIFYFDGRKWSAMASPVQVDLKAV
ncbi:MAG: hypothetical protein HYV63_15370 [Candidatus Schekmanbacteria bacterium]|nr:hypothetical protein [Candidatus Schekmanbacteria bacterium]